MSDPKKPKLRVLDFPKAEPPTAPPAGSMGFDILHLVVSPEDGNNAVDFLMKHKEEFPATPQNLMALLWTATRTLMNLGLPGEIAHVMVERACTWVPNQPNPESNKKPDLPKKGKL